MKKERDKRPVLIDNRYKTLKKLGAGAMGDVYKVRDLKDKKIMALKILSRGKTSSETVQRFKREFKLLTGLHHPNLCSVYDFGMLKDGRSYFTMEYVNGENIFKAAKGLPYKRIYPWIVQLCRTLEYIHSKGLIHYDLKPGNVLIAEGMEHGAKNNNKPYAQSSIHCVKLMDFGLAGEQRIKGGAMIKGTFPYIAPEVIKGLVVDHRADLYSLGVLLYEIFTRILFRVTAKESFVTLLKQRRDWVSKLPSKTVPNTPKMLDQLILRLLASEPSERYGRANEVIREINKFSHSRFEFETEKTLEGYLLSSRFVGRTKEMTLLKSLYEQARQGEGKVVLVTGDAGIGKTRLLKEFKISAQLQRSHCFTGSAYRDRVGPLEPFYEIFKELINYIKFRSGLSRELKLSFAVLFKLFPDLADEHLKKKLPKLVPLEPKQEKLRTFEALSELIRYTASNLGELVILLEDLHWADDLSFEYLEYLGRNLEDRNIFICGASRKEELEENLVFKKIITNLRKQNYFTQIELRFLNFRSLYSFLDSTITPGSNSPKLTRYLMEKTGGNPFFVEEIMRTLLQERKANIGERIGIEHFKKVSIPETIEEIVIKRIKDLHSASQKVVRFGAVLQKDFSYSLMKRLTGLDDTELSRALWVLKKRQVLIEEDTKYRFYHETLREAVNKRLSNQKKRGLNYQVGKNLERIYQGRREKVVEDLAYYFINAKDNKKGVFYGLRAAKKSSKRYANEQAIRFYRGVLKLIGNKNSKSRFDVLPKLARIENLVGYNDDAIKHYNNALNMEIGTIEEKIEIYKGMAVAYIRKGKLRSALHCYKKAHKLINTMKPGKLKVLLRTNITGRIYHTFLRMDDYESPKKLKLNELTHLRDLEDLKGKKAMKLLADTYGTMGGIELPKGEETKTGYDRAIFYYNKAYKIYKAMKTEEKMAGVLINLCFCYSSKFEFQKGVDCFQKSIRISKKIGHQHFVSALYFNFGNNLRNRGFYSKALDYFQKALVISRKIADPIRTAGSLLGIGMCFLRLCKPKKAKEFCEKTLKVFHSMGWEDHKIYPIEVIGAINQSLADYTIALRFYRKALKISKDIQYQKGITSLFIDFGSCFIELGKFSKAKRYIDDALKIAEFIGAKDKEIECYIHLCRIHVILKDYVSAIGYYRKGMRTAKEIGMRKQILQFFLLATEIDYYEQKYSKGIKSANKAKKMAKEMGTRDVYAKALLLKAKHEIRRGIIPKIDIIKFLDEAKEIAEGIGCPEVLWKVYFEYGRFLQDGRRFRKALDYYQRCCEIFEDVGSKIKNKSYKRSYLNHPYRQAVFIAANELEKLLD